MKHLFVFISVKKNLFVSVFVHKCLMMLNDVEYTTFKMFATQMNNSLCYFFSIIALSFSQSLTRNCKFEASTYKKFSVHFLLINVDIQYMEIHTGFLLDKRFGGEQKAIDHCFLNNRYSFYCF